MELMEGGQRRANALFFEQARNLNIHGSARDPLCLPLADVKQARVFV